MHSRISQLMGIYINGVRKLFIWLKHWIVWIQSYTQNQQIELWDDQQVPNYSNKVFICSLLTCLLDGTYKVNGHETQEKEFKHIKTTLGFCTVRKAALYKHASSNFVTHFGGAEWIKKDDIVYHKIKWVQGTATQDTLEENVLVLFCILWK